jgi:hypothetical protein
MTGRCCSPGQGIGSRRGCWGVHRYATVKKVWPFSRQKDKRNQVVICIPSAKADVHSSHESQLLIDDAELLVVDPV